LIRTEKLNFNYGNKHILKDIDIDIKKGKFTGILGPNGSGKSTLLKNVLGYLQPESGKILLNGRSLKSITRKEAARIVGFVPQKSGFSMNINVEDFVMLGRIPHLKNKWSGFQKKDRDVCNKIIYELNLENFRDRSVLSLSGGEFQRVLVARALCQEPEVLLLDEPTSALDMNYAVDILSTVRDLVEIKNLTAVAVLHDLNLASIFCSELILMKEGKIEHCGKPKELMNEKILKDIYGFDSKVIYEDDETPYIIPVCNGRRGVVNV
jgi:iron complex transport system ATP-binding protein